MRNFSVLSLIVLSCSLSVQAVEILSLKDYLKAELSTSAKMAKETFNLSADQVKELSAVAPDSEDKSFTFYYAKSSEGKNEKACLVVPQRGKEGPLSVGVCFNPQGLVTGVKVLAHEEERGKKIEEVAFLKQFTGKKVTDAYVLGKDVDGISGATWSSKAMAEAVRKAGFAFKTFVQGK